MVADEEDVEFARDLLGRDDRRGDFVRRAEIEVQADEEIVRLDQPARVAGPPDGDAFVVGTELIQNRWGGLGLDASRECD